MKVEKIFGPILNSRFSGENFRKKIINQLKENEQVIIDFSNINLITQSFADESFGKLAQKMGIKKFKEKINIKNVNKNVGKIIKLVIRQRVKNKKDKQNKMLA